MNRRENQRTIMQKSMLYIPEDPISSHMRNTMTQDLSASTTLQCQSAVQDGILTCLLVYPHRLALL